MIIITIIIIIIIIIIEILISVKSLLERQFLKRSLLL